MKVDFRQLTRYMLIGGLAAACHYITAGALHYFGTPVIFGTPSGFLVGFLVSLIGHREITFKSSKSYSFIAPRMLLLALFGVMYNSVSSAALVSFGVNAYGAILFAVVTTPLVNYQIMRLWIFRI
jgi:putative flippase GtrA